jgi:hypothetical protein
MLVYHILDKHANLVITISKIWIMSLSENSIGILIFNYKHVLYWTKHLKGLSKILSKGLQDILVLSCRLWLRNL